MNNIVIHYNEKKLTLRKEEFRMIVKCVRNERNLLRDYQFNDDGEIIEEVIEDFQQADQLLKMLVDVSLPIR